ncbi:protein disulfide isomerase-like 1-6 isoform X2 [Macadamia integrifolia]|uniref:protein disulfide isomerase-like 1-6 isoform X2 n=1 Tax=Macadamia integrifolia TaxID=60698 RepID=UPI001C4FDCC5|nr:protein disulfide isomerase-like 1-6 isoform X2 [Macadamia integrifolia]
MKIPQSDQHFCRSSVITMLITKPTSRFVYFTIGLLLFLCFIVPITASESVTNANDDNDLEGFEELLALDEEEQEHKDAQVRSSEAEILTKAQRIVLELNNDNFKRVIDGNEFVLLLGYTPWCARSAELMPQFAEAATVLKDVGSSLLMAKLDAERYPKAASKLGIKGYPTLLLFVNGSSQAYTGGFTAEEIAIWARKKTGAPTIRLNSIAEAEQFLKKHPMFIIGLFEKFEGPDYEEFVKAASEGNEIQFVETCNAEVAKALFPDIATRNLFLGLVKSEPEKYAQFDDTFKKERILEFLEYNKFPLVTMLSELNSVRVFSSPVKLQVFIFASTDELKNHKDLLQDVARKFKSKQIMFLFVDIAEENLAKPFLSLFGLEESQETIVTAFDNKISSKYLLESDLTMSSLEEFCSRLLQGTQPPYFKSEAIPDNKGKTIQTVVGRTFDDIVLRSPQNIFLEVHTPWCIDCEKTSKQIEKLAKHFKGLNSLIFARIDASTNEHPKLQITGYPALLFYPSTDKSNPIKLPAKSSLKDLAAFINNNVKDAGEDGKPTQDQPGKDEL